MEARIRTGLITMTSSHNAPPDTPESLRSFGLIMAGMLIFMFAFVLPWLFSYNMPYWPFIAALGFAVAGMLRPMLLAPVNKIWLKLSNVLGWINTRIIMGIMYFLLIVPIGLLLKLLGKDPLADMSSANTDSYRIVTKPRDKKHLERPF